MLLIVLYEVMKLEYMILGLLILSSRTIYQLRQRIDKGLGLMYSSSTGSIQASLKKLVSNGYITASETVENGRHKKIYCITDAGRDYFSKWIDSPLSSAEIRCPELTKLYFLGLGTAEKRKDILESYIAAMRERLSALTVISNEGDEMIESEQYRSMPLKMRDIIVFQNASAKFGRDLIEFVIRWYERLIEEMEENHE